MLLDRRLPSAVTLWPGLWGVRERHPLGDRSEMADGVIAVEYIWARRQRQQKSPGPVLQHVPAARGGGCDIPLDLTRILTVGPGADRVSGHRTTGVICGHGQRRRLEEVTG